MSFTTDQLTNPSVAPSGSTVYGRIVALTSGQFWDNNASALEAYSAGSIADYAVSAPEISTSGVYLLTIPSLPAGNYSIYYYLQSGGSPSVSDLFIGQTAAPFYWDGFTGVDLATILAQLASTVIIVSSPVDSDGNLSIVQGDTYSTASGNAITFTVATSSLPSLSGASASFAMVLTTTYNATGFSNPSLGPIAATITTNGSNTIFTVQLTAAQTAALTTAPTANCPNYTYQLRVTLAGGALFSISLGVATVTKRVLAQP